MVRADREDERGKGVGVWEDTRVCCLIIREGLTGVEECLVCYKWHEAAWRGWYLVDSHDWSSFSLNSYLGCEACVYPSSCVVKPMCSRWDWEARRLQ